MPHPALPPSAEPLPPGAAAGRLGRLLAALDARGELLRVRREVDPRFELAAVVRAVQQGPNQAVLFEKVRGSRWPVASNVFGSYRNVGAVLGVEPSEVAARWSALMRGGSGARGLEPPAEDGGFAEVALSELPMVTFCEKDAGPYLTAGIVAARDPDSGVVNLSYHRMQVVSDTELRCRLSSSGDLYRAHQKAERRGHSLEAAVLIGNAPAVMLAGAATVGPEVSELEVAERIARARVPLRKCETVALEVPASTDIVIEGEILAGVRRPEGPFGEWMDYYVPVTDNHVFQVRRVTARGGGFFYAILSGSPEEITLSAIPISGAVYQAARTFVPTVLDVVCVPALQFCVIRMKKQFEGQPRRAILAAFGAEMNRILYCVAVDEDVNPYDLKDVIWAMSTRCRPDRNIFQIPDVPSFARDPHQIHWGRVGIDATAPLEWPAEFERKRIPGADTIRLEDYV